MVTVITSSRYPVNRIQIREKIVQILKDHVINKEAAVNVVFFGKNKMRALSKKYKKEDEALPVLAFPNASVEDPPSDITSEINIDLDIPLGEICICYPQAVLMAAQREKAVDQIILELVEHGLKNILRK